MRSRTLLLVALLAVTGVLAAGCDTKSDGEKTAAGAEPGTEAPAGEAYTRLDPDAFADRMKEESAVVINVHIPYEGEIEDTDAFIPYDKIVGDSRLPEDKDRQILLYCRSGRMSEEAGAALFGAGYTKLAHLEGGMNAWEHSGRDLIQNPAHAGDHGTPGHKM
ncbi:MAG TPA: rhodanese-like domain-containing protein [Acidimicrobiia bacterium]|nr:rhodanese-like domain-containing protein [Acidimicrobiia bacterium]